MLNVEAHTHHSHNPRSPYPDVSQNSEHDTYLRIIDWSIIIPETHNPLSGIRPAHVRISSKYRGRFIPNVEGSHHLRLNRLLCDSIGHYSVLGSSLHTFSFFRISSKGSLPSDGLHGDPKAPGHNCISQQVILTDISQILIRQSLLN